MSLNTKNSTQIVFYIMDWITKILIRMYIVHCTEVSSWCNALASFCFLMQVEYFISLLFQQKSLDLYFISSRNFLEKRTKIKSILFSFIIFYILNFFFSAATEFRIEKNKIFHLTYIYFAWNLIQCFELERKKILKFVKFPKMQYFLL